ncbi:hypothetical protein LCGC14_1490200 [marine sediment metagenome]|uniref:Phage head morphogenesis domain-containing protein n=1 Tax=marine sediment metagenome TaxID=412755 RepID=A0A0F9J7L3_9ZZZZ
MTAITSRGPVVFTDIIKVRSPSRAEQLRQIRTREKRMRSAVHKMLDGIPKIVTKAELRRAANRGQAGPKLLKRVKKHIRSHQDALLAALEPTALTKQTVDVAELASLQIGKLIADIGDRQLKTVREALVIVFEQGTSPEVLDTISGATGLSKPHLRAVENARLAAIDAGATQAAAAKTAARVRKRLLRFRAQLIARTESVRLAGAITQRFAEETGAKRKTWISARDGNVESLCRALDNGESIPINQEFPGGFMTPPRHGGCRCILDIS